MKPAPFIVLLIGNYRHDQQQSMQRFVRLLADELPRHAMVIEVCIPPAVFGNLKPAASGFGKWLGYLDKFLLFPIVLRRTLRRLERRPARVVVHICDHSNAHYTRYLAKTPHLTTCHDLLAVRIALGEFPPRRVSWTGRLLQRLILRGLRRAQRLACVSGATAADVRRLIRPSDAAVDVVPNGLNYDYRPMPRAEAFERLAALPAGGGKKLSATDRYLLHLGANHWYKNRLGVLRIYAALRDRWPIGAGDAPKLILAGAPLAAEMEQFVAAHPAWAADVAVLTGVEDNEDLRALYSAAELLLFPSLEEGFGWPVIEAQACGCPVVTTGKAPLTEVGGAAAIYLPPASVAGDAPEAWASAARIVGEALQESAAARGARSAAGLANARRFSTDGMVRRYVEIYRELATGGAPGASVRRDLPVIAGSKSDPHPVL